MFNTARLCAGTGHHDTANRLLEMSIALWPLRRASPRARIVQAALHSSGADERHRWRLEAVALTDGMMQPWPSSARDGSSTAFHGAHADGAICADGADCAADGGC